MITLTQLQYVVAVARHGNFRNAAKACFVTQPTLSMQIKKLEDELGVLLFDRAVHPIRPTPLGEKLIEQSAVVLGHAAKLEDLVRESKGALEGELRLAVIPTLAPYVLPLFVEAFARAHDKLRLHIEESTTDAILAALREHRIDVGLLATPLHEPMTRELPLFREPFYVYAEKDSRLARLDEVADGDLKDERILLLAEGHCLRSQVSRVCGLRDRKSARDGAGFQLESGSIETLCHLVDEGLGYTVIPHLARRWSATRSGRIVPFSDPQPSREVSLLVHESFTRDRLLEALATSIRRSLPPELRKPPAPLRTIALR
jgi:LysR family transcriptional regulator, hydrogen peroxide-inducible genes activator